MFKYVGKLFEFEYRDTTSVGGGDPPPEEERILVSAEDLRTTHSGRDHNNVTSRTPPSTPNKPSTTIDQNETKAESI